LGETDSGRLLSFVFSERGENVRIVTAYPMHKKQRAFYLAQESRPDMPRKRIEIPVFKSEKEEAQWWDKNPEALTQAIENASKEGRLKRLITTDKGSKTVTIRIPVSDIERAQHLAERKGLRYQTYMKMLLHEALERENAAAGK